MKNILWISDEPNWAYDVNAKALSSNQPQYKHHFIYTVQKGRAAVDLVMDDMDIIMAMNPAGFYMYSRFDKVIAIIDTVRALNDSNKDIFPKVAGIICTNLFLFQFAKTKNTKVIMQPNGVDLGTFKPATGSPSRKFTVGFAANIKGHYADYKGWNFYQEALRSLPGIEQLNVLYGESQITPDRMVPDFYHKIDCLVLPSRNEGCSNVVVEALACGVPVICTEVGYHGDFLRDGHECLFVERTNESVKAAILKMSTYPELFNNMKKEARGYATFHHCIKKVSERYANFFEKVLESIGENHV